MHQPILILRAGSEPTTALCAEILRCEGFPWFSEQSSDASVGDLVRDGPLQDGCSRLVLQNTWLVVPNAPLDTTLSQLHRPDQP
jgi:hypothetical protein